MLCMVRFGATRSSPRRVVTSLLRSISALRCVVASGSCWAAGKAKSDRCAPTSTWVTPRAATWAGFACPALPGIAGVAGNAAGLPTGPGVFCACAKGAANRPSGIRLTQHSIRCQCARLCLLVCMARGRPYACCPKITRSFPTHAPPRCRASHAPPAKLASLMTETAPPVQGCWPKSILFLTVRLHIHANPDQKDLRQCVRFF